LFDKNGKTSKVIPWNFAKFLLNEKGEVVKFFAPG
jgi:glutathione peroxidase-family protein